MAQGRAIGVLAVAVLAVAGCGDDGRDLRAPAPDQTTTTTTTTTGGSDTTAPGGVPADTGALELIGPFGTGGQIPETFTCDGDDAVPSLAWSGLPPGTAELGVSVVDPDAGGFVHWVIAGIDPGAGAIGEGPLPAGAAEAINDAGTVGWFGPCPPEGETHEYVFTLYALPSTSDLRPGLPGDEAIAALESTATETAELRGTYSRV